MLFERLPEVSKCCCLIPLKYGAVFIALFYITVNLYSHLSRPVLVCYLGIDNDNCAFKPRFHIFVYINHAIVVLFIAPSVLLIIGVFYNRRCLVSWFMYCASGAAAAELAADAAVLAASALLPHCYMGRLAFLTCLAATIADSFLFIYFLIVVKSFRTSITNGASLSPSREDVASIQLVDGKPVPAGGAAPDDDKPATLPPHL